MVGSPAARRMGTSIFVLVLAIFVAVRALGMYPWNDRIFDLWAYWTTRFGLDYAGAVPGHTGDYLYSPAFAHLIAPLTALPLPLFAASWTALLGIVLFWLTGWRAVMIALFAPVTISLAIGQTDLLMAAAVLIGFRWPAAWAIPFITKVTPGIGVLWFAFRREWRALAIATGATAAVVGISVLIDPAAWLGWLDMLLRSQFPPPSAGVYLPLSLWIRLPLVVALLWWGASTDRRWTVPFAVCFALPTVWINTPTILVACLPLLEWAADAPAGRWVRGGAALEWPRLGLRRRLRRAGLTLRRDLGGLGTA